MTTLPILPGLILAQLAGGHTMTAVQIAQALGATEADVHPVLAVMLSRGLICVNKRMTSKVGYQIEKPQPKVRERLNTSVAAPPKPPKLTGELTEYARMMRQSVELRMAVRAR